MASLDKVYEYQPLPTATSIRLLRLAAINNSDDFTCTLEVVDLKAPPEYIALSYFWGDTSVLEPIKCDGGVVMVTPTIRSMLRKFYVSIVGVWADAVCINQADIAERNQQVTVMADIYRKAATVAVWLGHDSHNDVEAVSPWLQDFIDKIARIDSMGARLTEMDIENGEVTGILPNGRRVSARLKLDIAFPTEEAEERLRRFLSQPWFSRTWVIQEVGLAADVNLVWQDNASEWNPIGLMAMYLVRYGRAWLNSYTFGQLGGHNVVIAYLPNMGKAAAAATAASFRTSFPNITIGLVVGICGRVPHPSHHNRPVFLGDVIISTSIVQYDFGRLRLIRKDTLDDNLPRPTKEIRSFLQRLQGWHESAELEEASAKYVVEICGKRGFGRGKRPPSDQDKLYRSEYRHKHHNTTNCECTQCSKPEDPICKAARDKTCEELECDERQLVPGQARRKGSSNTDAGNSEFRIHFGRIASGDGVVKSSVHRDRIAKEEKVIAFEMEGAGVWDSFPTIVIKGVCDHADSHKKRVWQEHAAVVAAACTKALLNEWPGIEETQAPSSSQRGVQSSGTPGTISHNTMRNEGDNYGSQTGFNFGTNNTHYYALQKNVDNIMMGKPMNIDPGQKSGR